MTILPRKDFPMKNQWKINTLLLLSMRRGEKPSIIYKEQTWPWLYKDPFPLKKNFHGQKIFKFNFFPEGKFVSANQILQNSNFLCGTFCWVEIMGLSGNNSFDWKWQIEMLKNTKLIKVFTLTIFDVNKGKRVSIISAIVSIACIRSCQSLLESCSTRLLTSSWSCEERFWAR